MALGQLIGQPLATCGYFNSIKIKYSQNLGSFFTQPRLGQCGYRACSLSVALATTAPVPPGLGLRVTSGALPAVGLLLGLEQSKKQVIRGTFCPYYPLMGVVQGWYLAPGFVSSQRATLIK